MGAAMFPQVEIVSTFVRTVQSPPVELYAHPQPLALTLFTSLFILLPVFYNLLLTCFSSVCQCLSKFYSKFVFLHIFYQLFFYRCYNYSPLTHCVQYPFHPSILTPCCMSVGRACKFFCFSIFYTVLNLSLSILYLQVMLLNPYVVSPILLLPPAI